MNAALAQFLINNSNRNTKKWNLLSVRKLLAHPPYFFCQGQQVHVELKTVKPCPSFATHQKNSNLHHEKGSVPRALQFSPLLGQCRCGMNRAEIFDRVYDAVELSLTPNPVQYINTSSRRIEEDRRGVYKMTTSSCRLFRFFRYADDKPAEFLRVVLYLLPVWKVAYLTLCEVCKALLNR